MTSILRQSSALARISKSSFRSAAARSSLRPSNHNPFASSRISVQQARTYAKANGSNGLKDDGKKDNAEVTPKGNQEPPSKSAPGTENLYNGKSPLSTHGTGEPNEESQTFERRKLSPEDQRMPDLLEEENKRRLKPAEANGMSKLTPEEERALDELFAEVNKRLLMPRGQAEMMRRVMETMKKEGIPDEIRKFVEETKDQPLTLWKAVNLASLISDMDGRQGKGDKDGKKTSSQGEGPKGFFGGASGEKPKGNPSGGWTWKLSPTDILTTAFAVALMYLVTGDMEASKEITYQEFRNTFFDKGLVEKLTVATGGTRVRVDLHREAVQAMYPDSPAAKPHFYYYFSIGSVESFERRLDEAQNELGIPSSERIPVSYSTATDSWALFMYLLPTLLFLVPILWISRRSGGAASQNGIFGMGKSRAKKFNHETDVKVKFKDVAGMDEAKAEIMEFVAFLKTPEQFQRLGAKIPRGAILSGPPGTGKTLLAKATAGESQVPFFSVSGSEFVEMFVGVGASRVRDLFAMARKSTPCIIFIDEIDAIGKSRGNGRSFGGNDEREATLNQILTEMDGFNTAEQVVVLAGTNRVDVLDKALLRPGRFDRHIAIDRPTMDGRKQIFLVHLSKIVTNENMEYLSGRLAALTPGFSGADIANCCNEAALIAARTSAKSVAMIHFEQAIERVIGGLEKKSLVLSPEEKKTVAYHEAGHAICGWYLKHADPLLKVSIIPRGQGALGYAQYLPAGDTYLMNVNQLMDRMAMTLGGRISEELHFDTVTSGASDDFNKVTRMATAMVTKWGMSKKLGPLHFEDDENKLHKPFAESTAQTIDSEVRRIVDEAYQKCLELLTAKKTDIGLIAEELLAKEVLGRDDMVRLLGPRPFDENKDFTKYFGKDSHAPPPFPTETDTPSDQPSP